MMRNHAAACIAGVLGALALGWASGAVLEWGLSNSDGLRFREIPAPEARRLLTRRGAVLVEVLSTGHVARSVVEATLAFPDGPLPPALHAGPPAVVVLAGEPWAGYRMAARLARAGIQEVAVVEGGVEAWRRLHPHLATERGTERPRAPARRRGETSDGRAG